MSKHLEYINLLLLQFQHARLISVVKQIQYLHVEFNGLVLVLYCIDFI